MSLLFPFEVDKQSERRLFKTVFFITKFQCAQNTQLGHPFQHLGSETSWLVNRNLGGLETPGSS